MIPILFSPTATDFTTNGIGRLIDTISCKVEEERNGEYELKLVYPTSGEFYDKIQNDSLIVVKPSYGAKRQAFRVYNKTSSLGYRCSILARHISYDTKYIPIKPFNATGIQNTLDILNDKVSANRVNYVDNPFLIYTDVENTDTIYNTTAPRSLRACLGGDEGSILDRFSGRGTGEYEWDNFNIFFRKNRGSDKGYTCRYGKNIVSLERELDSESFFTGAIGYWQDYEGETTVTGSVQYADNSRAYPIQKVSVIDFSSDFEEEPTVEDLNAAAKLFADAYCDIDDSIDLDFYDQDNQAVQLCDTIRVIFSKIGVDVTVKVVKTVWDVLLEKYEKITVGSPRSTLDRTLANDQDSKASLPGPVAEEER